MRCPVCSVDAFALGQDLPFPQCEICEKWYTVGQSIFVDYTKGYASGHTCLGSPREIDGGGMSMFSIYNTPVNLRPAPLTKVTKDRTWHGGHRFRVLIEWLGNEPSRGTTRGHLYVDPRKPR